MAIGSVRSPRKRWPARSLDQAYRAGRREEVVAALPDRRRHRARHERRARKPSGLPDRDEGCRDAGGFMT